MHNLKEDIKTISMLNQLKNATYLSYRFNNREETLERLEDVEVIMPAGYNKDTNYNLNMVESERLSENDGSKSFAKYIECRYKYGFECKKIGTVDIGISSFWSASEFKPFELIQNDTNTNPFNQINYKNNQKRHKLYFSLYSSTTSKSSTDKNKYTRRMYSSYFMLHTYPEDEYTYIMVIVYADASLPTVILSRTPFGNKIGTYSTDNAFFNNIVFSRKKDESRNYFSSYFVPHMFSIEEGTNYPNTVFGVPGEQYSNMIFDETYKSDGTYCNADGISTDYNGQDILDVIISNYIFGYRNDNTKECGIYFLNEFSNIVKTYNSEASMDKDHIITLNEVMEKHEKYKDIINSALKGVGNCLQIPSIDADSILYLFNYTEYNTVGAFKITEGVDAAGSVIEIVYPVLLKEEGNLPSFVYSIFTLDGYSYNYQYNGSLDKIDTNEFVSYTNNRTIAKSKEAMMVLMDKGKYNYTVDNSGAVISSNLPFSHATQKNIFGF